jgi:hypothetical protein
LVMIAPKAICKPCPPTKSLQQNSVCKLIRKHTIYIFLEWRQKLLPSWYQITRKRPRATSGGMPKQFLVVRPPRLGLLHRGETAGVGVRASTKSPPLCAVASVNFGFCRSQVNENGRVWCSHAVAVGRCHPRSSKSRCQARRGGEGTPGRGRRSDPTKL